MHTPKNEILNIIFGSVLVLGFIISYFIYTLIKQNRRVAKWQEERIKAEVNTLENERRRIAGDLHDDIGPMLSAIKLQVNHVEPANDDEKLIIEKSGRLMDEVIQHFREIAYNLLPNTLIRKGLVAAIEEFISKINEKQSLNISFTHHENIHLPAEAELNLYRIVQEITHNTIKHAEASQLTLRLLLQNKKLILSTNDNGKGFLYNEPTTTAAAGLGLLNIRNRVTLLNGRLSIKSDNVRGTEYIIIIPLDKYDQPAA